ncbi:hypothetical protein [Virgibacillus oceani]|uniref:Uncharacterized protein n=1 Tax=Virgibacillus oceani TaxID=1479511 RepID=A0A917HEP4_9BACI|nr:hypothetical protein [Virgibacillus oceani]GGG76717.1 hypothetical protein GCM10011398_22170 [Virgibacillus oceani]
MSVIKVFRNYMQEHHPHLEHEDWKADVRLLSAKEIQNVNIKALLPQEINEPITCWLFFYDGGLNHVVCLLQDKKGVTNLGISLLKNGEPVKPISFYK